MNAMKLLLAKTKLVTVINTVLHYIEKKKPRTLAEAEHMLNLISVMLSETLQEAEEVTG